VPGKDKVKPVPSLEDSSGDTFIVATIRKWNIAEFQRRQSRLQGRWHLVTDPADLTADFIRSTKARYVFFPHWSWRVPDDVLQAAECVSFHMTDLPYGRGGSPLQNLIARGHEQTMISALRLVREMDAGPIYAKRQLSLQGRAQEIFERAAVVVFDLIDHIVRTNPQPLPQTGEPVLFSRRSPAESILPQSGDTKSLFDHIRMLDAEGYPKAFLEYGGFTLVFDRARLTSDGVEARVVISPLKSSAP
jgi:methionyl-tRNA formyltransferase